MRRLTPLLLLVLLAGCDDGDGGGSGYIETRIDGTRWRATATEGIVVYPGEDPEGPGSIYTIAWKGVGAGQQFLTLNIPNPPELGSQPLGGEGATASFVSCPDDELADCIWWGPIGSDAGALAITLMDPESGRITGTFSFTGYPLGDSTGTTKSFAQGVFDIRAPGVFVLE